jgi:DNA-binding NtrC family response regulator
LIAATNRDLDTSVTEEKFRGDLYYRLKGITIELPPIRDRGDDVLLLADHFCSQLSAKYDIPNLTVSPAARKLLRKHNWPGNVRELQHALESAALTIEGSDINDKDLPLSTTFYGDPSHKAEQAIDKDQSINLEEVEKSLIERALLQTDGNVSAAARLLSIGREALRYRMNKFGLGTDFTESNDENN